MFENLFHLVPGTDQNVPRKVNHYDLADPIVRRVHSVDYDLQALFGTAVDLNHAPSRQTRALAKPLRPAHDSCHPIPGTSAARLLPEV